ncbi:MAG: N-acetylmuramic acid 6-phosphate etherase [Streptococcaceae bacterium]|jgi:N-acetylmuramic acid 6-phosphate etherase|nr:N-acetylmuramic acid 6-phosphate etherase [Streptococcaceae bacterium]
MIEQMQSTEGRNPKSMQIDTFSGLEIAQLMNQEDRVVPVAIESQLENIGKIIEGCVESFNAGGRLIYFGAGTSGRLGVLDAAECVPTFGVSPDMVVGLIAGGEKAMLVAVEGAEDSKELAVADLKNVNINENDMVIGLAASGRTPYVVGGLDYANEIGAKTAAISCNAHALISQHAKTAVELVVGPEVLTGSTRLKAGTAQKLVLNMISTGAMIRIGKAYENLMVDVQPTNIKLVDRAKRIIMEATGVDIKTASNAFELSNGHSKTAIVMILAMVDAPTAKNALDQTKGFIKKAISYIAKEGK